MLHLHWRRLSVALALLLVSTLGVAHWLSGPPVAASVSRTQLVGRTASATPQRPTARVQKSSSVGSSLPLTGSPRGAARRVPVTGLKRNSLYQTRLQGPGNCQAKVRRPNPPLKDSALAPYLRTVVNCLFNAFRAPLARDGFTLHRPAVRTYRGTISTPCGRLSSNYNPSYYCAGTIYWPVSGDDGRQAYTLARLGYVGLIAHEFGHHLQATSGMLADYSSRYFQSSRSQRYALSRRLELQAQCFEGVFLSFDRQALHISSRDRTELRRWHSYTGDEDPPAGRLPDHGTSRAQFGWLVRGLDSGSFGSCDTWTAPASTVK